MLYPFHVFKRNLSCLALLVSMSFPVCASAQDQQPLEGQLTVEGELGTKTLQRGGAVPSPLPSQTSRSPEIWTSFRLADKPPFSGRIAFSADVDDQMKILQLDLSTKKVTSLIDGPGNNYFPNWSPDGESLVFVSDRDGNREIYVADWQGKNQRRLTFHDLPDDNPSWHPDGKRVVFYRDEDPENSDIFILDSTKNTPATKVTELGGRNTTPRVHPDGHRIVYSTNRFWPGWDVCEWNLRSQSEFCVLAGTESYCRASWSNGGNLLAYTYGLGSNLSLGVLEFDTRRKIEVTNMKLRDYDVTFIDDDKHLLFVAEAGLAGRFRLHYIPYGKEEAVKLLDSDYSVRYPSWSGRTALEIEASRIKAEQALREAELANRSRGSVDTVDEERVPNEE